MNATFTYEFSSKNQSESVMEAKVKYVLDYKIQASIEAISATLVSTNPAHDSAEIVIELSAEMAAMTEEQRDAVLKDTFKGILRAWIPLGDEISETITYS